jgi:hypothetical protein
MAITFDRLVLSDEGFDPEEGMLHAASPILIGLVGAVIAMSLIAPGMMRNVQLLVTSVLVPLLVASIVFYAWSVIAPGDVKGLVIDPDSRTVELVQSNWLASRRTPVPFADIVKIERAKGLDRDGYEREGGLMTLETGDRIPLAMALDEGQIAQLKRMMRLK